MRRIYGTVLLAALSAAALFSGCAAPEQSCRGSGRNGEILAESFCRNRAKDFLDPLSETARKDFGEKEFHASRKKVCGELGKPVSKCKLGRLKHPFLNIDLWRISFEKTGSDGKKITRDAVFQVVSTTENGKEKVISFGFL